jgi:hypothetical protein
MLTDTFNKRYPNRIYYGDGFPIEVGKLLHQAGQIIAEDVYSKIPTSNHLFKNVHDRLAREYGAGRLGEGSTYEEICLRVLFERYDLWNDNHGDQDFFLKLRLSLVELLLRSAEEFLKELHKTRDLSIISSLLSKRTHPDRKSKEEMAIDHFLNSIDELNQRFREAKMPFSYHNGFIQFVEDRFTSENIDEPFWGLLSDTKWKNVDYEMKEAIDSRDAGKEESITFALKALESTIKIICQEKNWSSGHEKGASNYIDNLVSKQNGRFIEVWESEAIRHLFTNLRNPRSHGAGSDEMPKTNQYQRSWAIESCMSWIKSLINRL